MFAAAPSPQTAPTLPRSGGIRNPDWRYQRDTDLRRTFAAERRRIKAEQKPQPPVLTNVVSVVPAAQRTRGAA